MPALPDRVRHEFAALALGYYAAGRLALRAGAGDLAAGHILHHAVEFVLKATLARHTTLADMKKFGHKLTELFSAAESRSAELRTPEHKATAAALHDVWELRFPDRILSAEEGLVFSPGELTAGQRAGAAAEEQKSYVLELARIDRLFCAAFRAAGLNPAAFASQLGPEALRAIRTENPESAFFSSDGPA